MSKEKLVQLAKSEEIKVLVEALNKQRILFLNRLESEMIAPSESNELKNKLASVAFGINYVLSELQRLDTDSSNSDLYKLPE